jgi:hypothetical protein
MRKEIPILFSTEMVQAILKGRKTMTRRIVKWPTTPDWHDYDYDPNIVVRPNGGDWWPHFQHINGGQDKTGALKSRYGNPGDLLWVRETWGKNYFDESIVYKAGPFSQDYDPHFVPGDCKFLLDERWKPSIHMPKDAARIWLEVTDIKVERLHDITGYDVLQEGIGRPLPFARSMTQAKMDYESREPGLKKEFEELWQKINGPESWEANPWVWVVSFKVLSTAGRP